MCSHFYAGVIFSTYVHMWESTRVQITKSDPGSAHICMSASFVFLVFFVTHYIYSAAEMLQSTKYAFAYYLYFREL